MESFLWEWDMKKIGIGFIFIFMFSLLVLKASLLTGHPLALFLLKGQGDTIQAFKISAYLSGEESRVEAIMLSSEQKEQGWKLLDQRNVGDLEAFSKSFGAYSAVIGMPTTVEGWPDYLGNGLKWITDGKGKDVFDDLQWADRVYFAFVLKAPSPVPFSPTEPSSSRAIKNNVITTPPAAVITPTPESHPGVVRVEILNGCGITNAAEWAARRMKGAGISIVDSGNADNFDYAKTIVRTSGEIPTALEEALGRLGLSKDSIQETSAPSPAIDVVVIVGKDFRKLKRHRHE
jgi:hypothetical protein